MKKKRKKWAASGDLRFYLLLERPNATADEIGGSPRDPGWTAVTGLWCDVMPRSAVERIVGAQLTELTSHVIESHFWSNWKKGDRFRFVDENDSGKSHYYKLISRLNINQSGTRIFWEAEEYDGSDAE